jgi:hypothetical protein
MTFQARGEDAVAYVLDGEQSVHAAGSRSGQCHRPIISKIATPQQSAGTTIIDGSPADGTLLDGAGRASAEPGRLVGATQRRCRDPLTLYHGIDASIAGG